MRDGGGRGWACRRPSRASGALHATGFAVCGNVTTRKRFFPFSETPPKLALFPLDSDLSSNNKRGARRGGGGSAQQQVGGLPAGSPPAQIPFPQSQVPNNHTRPTRVRGGVPAPFCRRLFPPHPHPHFSTTQPQTGQSILTSSTINCWIRGSPLFSSLYLWGKAPPPSSSRSPDSNTPPSPRPRSRGRTRAPSCAVSSSTPSSASSSTTAVRPCPWMSLGGWRGGGLEPRASPLLSSSGTTVPVGVVAPRKVESKNRWSPRFQSRVFKFPIQGNIPVSYRILWCFFWRFHHQQSATSTSHRNHPGPEPDDRIVVFQRNIKPSPPTKNHRSPA